MKNQPGVKHGFKQKLRRAFTITELVIVIAVIAILAAVLIPTFSAVVNNSKKSHDEQYVKMLNEALAQYTVTNKAAPKDYQELMIGLHEVDDALCDASNVFLLSSKLKQDNMVLVWYPDQINTIVLLDVSPSSEYNIQFTSSVGLGNGVYVYEKTAAGGTQVGYVLCSTSDPDGATIAECYEDYYVKAGGDITKFINTFGGKYSSETFLSEVNNKAWGNSIISAITNQKTGYTYSESIAQQVKEQAQSKSEISLAIKADNYATGTEADKTAVEQSVRSALATLSRLANTTADAEVMANKTVTLAPTGSSNTALEGVKVDMKDVQMTAIGNVYRKSYEKEDVDRGSFSVNFSGVTITGMQVAQNELVSSGAEYQTESDCSYPGGAYVFSYGLFGTLHASKGQQVKLSNLTIEGVDMNLNGATETINGQKYNTATDMAGIVVGYTQGNVVLENIKVSGKQVGGGRGEFSGFDGVSGLVGRAYANAGETAETLTIKNCSVEDININGQRRAAGLVAYAGKSISVKIEDTTLKNVTVTCQRDDGNAGIYSGAVGHIASGVKITYDGLTLQDIKTNIQYKPDKGTDKSWINIYDTANYPGAGNIKTNKTIGGKAYTYTLLQNNTFVKYSKDYDSQLFKTYALDKCIYLKFGENDYLILSYNDFNYAIDLDNVTTVDAMPTKIKFTNLTAPVLTSKGITVIKGDQQKTFTSIEYGLSATGNRPATVSLG